MRRSTRFPFTHQDPAWSNGERPYQRDVRRIGVDGPLIGHTVLIPELAR